MSVLRLEGVGLRRDGRALLDGIDWVVEPGEHWVLLGANGSGKTSLIRIASLYEHPSAGLVEVDGQRLGSTDVRSLRRRIGLVSPALADMVRPQLLAEQIVMCAKHAALEPWWHDYDDEDLARAAQLLHEQGIGSLRGRAFATLSSGERQRVLLARSAMAPHALVLLDEPSAGLDLGAREQLVGQLEQLAAVPSTAPMVLVTHHVEEIPAGFTHLLALRNGRVLRQGPLEQVLDGELISEAFDIELGLDRHDDGRWTARRRHHG